MRDLSEQGLTDGPAPGRVRGWWRPVLLVAVIGALWAVASTMGADRELADLREWISSLGPVAPVVFILLRAGAAVAVIPGSALSAAAGLLFGPFVGIVCVSAGKTLGAAVAFLIARHSARDAVARWLARKTRSRRLDDLVAEHGALSIAVMRLIPVVPFNVQNYGFGLTRVPFGTYLFWSWLCMLPGAVLVVVGMGIVWEVLASGEVPWVMLGVLAATVLLMMVLGGYAVLRLRARRKGPAPDEAPKGADA